MGIGGTQSFLPAVTAVRMLGTWSRQRRKVTTVKLEKSEPVIREPSPGR